MSEGDGGREREGERGERERERVGEGKVGESDKLSSSLSQIFVIQQIAQSLESMLNYDGHAGSFEDTFMATFRVSFSDVFGHMHTHDLKKDGDSIPVTKGNCKVSKKPTLVWNLLIPCAKYAMSAIYEITAVQGVTGKMSDLYRNADLRISRQFSQRNNK